ncbi:MAG: homocysteine S-methyltransferase family protein [Alphaproteobacteria bacterium]|nr:homocysteine S-methyltransferase family protein [Alphaproteobacteria bacterium]
MTAHSGFTEFFKKTPCIILGGAMGTELQRRGFLTTLPLWSARANLDAPDLVTQIHADYFNAGADTCITNTFRTTPRAFRKAGREKDAHDALKHALESAHKAKNAVKGRKVFIGGSFAPLEDCYEPDLVPGADELASEHGLHVEWLINESVDFLIAETVNAIDEAVAMAKAASDTGMPFIISFVVDSDARLLDGTPMQEAIAQTNLPGRLAVGINCRPIDITDSAYSKFTDHKEEFALYPNGIGHPHDELGWIFEENEDSIEKFVSASLRWHKHGARMLGGCCGTTPNYIAALAAAVK